MDSHESLSRKITPNYLQPVESFTETDMPNRSAEEGSSNGGRCYFDLDLLWT